MAETGRTPPPDLPRLPSPSELGLSEDHPLVAHGDFHSRPDFRGSDEVLVLDPLPPKIRGLMGAPLGVHGRMPGVPFASPRSFTAGRITAPRFIVIHYTAGSEGPTAAEDGAAYDQRRTDGTSCHFFIDQNSIVQCVDADDRAHSCFWNGNNYGIQLELCGTQQTTAQWRDPASKATIKNAARVCAWAMTQYNIPMDQLFVREVRTGRGICGHKDVTLGYPEDNGSHMDPDGNLPGSFPYADLFEEIGKILVGEDEVELDDDVVIPSNLKDSYIKAGSPPPAQDKVARLLWLAPLRGLEATKSVRDLSVVVGALDDKVDALKDSQAEPIDYDLLASKTAAILAPLVASAVATATADELRKRLES